MAGAIRKEPIGKLRHRCRVEALSAAPSRNEFGAPVPVWASEATVWCKVGPRPTDTQEQRRGSSQQADCTHVVTMRYRAGVTAKKRLVWVRGAVETTLNIVSVGQVEGSENWLEVYCKSEQ